MPNWPRPSDGTDPPWTANPCRDARRRMGRPAARLDEGRLAPTAPRSRRTPGGPMTVTVELRTCAWMALAGLAAFAQVPAPRPTLQQLEQRAAGLVPSKEQLRYQEIPWVHDLAEA